LGDENPAITHDGIFGQPILGGEAQTMAHPLFALFASGHFFIFLCLPHITR